MSARGKQTKRLRRLLALLLVLFSTGVSLLGYALLLPEASGTDKKEKGGAVLDYSHADQGYFLIKRESKKKQRLTVSKGKSTYNYDLPGDGKYHVIPFQMGSGKYEITLYENTSGKKYSSKISKDVSVNLVDENIPFLYPNIYSNYGSKTKAVVKAAELCEGLTSDLDKYKAISAFIKSSVSYDYAKAGSVMNGKTKTYIPKVDAVLKAGKGICFDYAALAACMLRSQGVPTQIVMGYFVQEGKSSKEKAYHAWNMVLIDGKWSRADITFSLTGTKGSYTNEFIY